MAPVEERRKSTLTETEISALAARLSERFLGDNGFLDLLADKVEENLWEGWYKQIGRITLRASVLLGGALGSILLLWATSGSKLGALLEKILL